MTVSLEKQEVHTEKLSYNFDEDELRKALQNGKIDFIDLGSGNGESIRYCSRKFNAARGVGFDISKKKVHQARELGLPVILQDVAHLQSHEGCVSFVSMMDFLEHLPSIRVAEGILESAARTARDFLFIRHPNFDSDSYLASLGLKFGWSDWRGHTNMMTISDYHEIFQRLGLREYVIIPQKQIFDSAHHSIVPQTAPRDTVVYDSAQHGEKNFQYFTQPVYTQYDILVRLPSNIHRSLFDFAIHRIVSTVETSAQSESSCGNSRKILQLSRAFKAALQRIAIRQ